MKSIPFYLLLIMTFGLAGLEKLTPQGVPEWFTKQFQNTLLDLFPGSLTASYILIALAEWITVALLVGGLARREFLPSVPKKLLPMGLISAQLTFVALGFGQRLTNHYDAAASLFFYAVLTFVGSHIALKETEPRHF